jgi:hypothetical protein
MTTGGIELKSKTKNGKDVYPSRTSPLLVETISYIAGVHERAHPVVRIKDQFPNRFLNRRWRRRAQNAVAADGELFAGLGTAGDVLNAYPHS